MTFRRTLKNRLGRRSFLRGAAGVSVALPFLESLPDRSAWAAGEDPVFSLFICAMGGVVPEKFFPNAPGRLTSAGLAAAGKATSQLAAHADRLLFVSGVDYLASTTEVHNEGICMSLTGRLPRSRQSGEYCGGECVIATGRSADWEVCEQARPGTKPLVIYWGQRAFTSEQLSFPGEGVPARGITNPYEVYQELVGLAGPDGNTTPEGDQASRLLLESRASVHDLVRDELRALMAHPRLGSTDRQRLEQHFDSIRDVETTMGGMANEAVDYCSSQGLDLDLLDSLLDAKYSSKRTEEMVQLHLSLVALAFACNYCRSASLQWGDAFDGSLYDVPSNDRNWTFAHISHRLKSDTSGGDDALAAVAHAEIDVLRMATLASGLDHFEARGLGDKALVLWTNQFAEGWSHSVQSVPHIIWGSPRGYLKQGEYVHAGGVMNNRLLTTVVSAAISDTGKTIDDFGGAEGQLAVLRA